MGKSLPERRIKLPSQTIRDDFLKTKLNAWCLKLRSTRPKMMLTAIVSNRRMPLKTIVIPLRDQLVVMKLPQRWILRRRPVWKEKLKKLLVGSTATLPPKRRNTKRSKRNSKVSPCLSYKRWEALLEQEVHLEAPLLPKTPPEGLPSKKLIKHRVLSSITVIDK